MKGTFYLVILAFCGLVLYLGLDNLMVENPAVKLAEHDELIMYSITDCEYCEVKRRELDRAQIPYVEHVVDRQMDVGRQLTEKLSQAGFSTTAVGYPSFDIKGTLVPNNPPLMQIKKLLKDDDA